MNAVEIEEAVTKLADEPFDPEEFPFQFLEAFGNKEVTIKRLRKGDSNKSDIPGALLQVNNIHIAVTAPGDTSLKRRQLLESKATTKHKAKFVLATDGDSLEAEELASGEVLNSTFQDLPNHFGFFLPLAGITTVQAIKDNPIDVRATSRLNKLYVELLKANPDWATEAKKPEMNHFLARLIFCFFAEDTGIFMPEHFTKTVQLMSESDGSNTAWVLERCFEAMNLDKDARKKLDLKGWADGFPFVNGGLFSGSMEVPKFTKIGRSYLLRAGELNWKEINPDIFGSMIQAVADDEERGALGMHYTSVPNILKVLNPLFLDDLRAHLAEAGDSKVKLLNLRKRIARIRVFDPACGSGNFLVIAYKQMREIEAKINERRGEKDKRSELPVSNFRGIEIRDFAAEIARLALIIAEYQCNLIYIGQQEAKEMFLPLQKENWIKCGNALRLNWLEVCPPTGTGVRITAPDLFDTWLDQKEIDFENEGGETFICGNPPYVGATVKAPKGASKAIRDRLKKEAESRKADMKAIFGERTDNWKSLDYVSGWFVKYADYARETQAACAFVSTNSITQGEQVARLWPLVLSNKAKIKFAFTSFKWANLAASNAGVTVVVIGLTCNLSSGATLYNVADDGNISRREVENINAYLVPYANLIVEARSSAMSGLPRMTNGNKPADGGHLILSGTEARELLNSEPAASQFLRSFIGTEDTIHGYARYCLWIDESRACVARTINLIKVRLDSVAEMRFESPKKLTRDGALKPWAFQQVRQTGDECVILVPRHSSETRDYLPASLWGKGAIVADGAFGIFDADLWAFSTLTSRLHLIWVATICGKIKTDYRYSNTLGWNTFPMPTLTDEDKAALTHRAEDILLAREHHWPATIADLYKPDSMPEDLRRAHERNDETLERIYIGRKFKNDTERLEHLFDLYTKLTAKKK